VRLVVANALESDSDSRATTIFCFIFSKKMKRETTPRFKYMAISKKDIIFKFKK